MAVETRTEARATFVFHALDTDGRETSGTMAAASAEEVARKLRAEGRTVLSIGRDEAIAASASTPRGSRARRGDLAMLCRHLGTMADAGVPISEALEAAAAVVAESPLVEGRDANDIAFALDRTTTDPSHYPLVLVSYSIVCSEYADAAQGELVKAYIGYITSAEGQQVAADSAGAAPLSEDLSAKVAAALEAVK